MKTLPIAVLLSVTVSFDAFAHEVKAGDLLIAHPYVIETTKTARSGAGYMSITNTGAAADRLIAVEASFPRVMIHGNESENGVSRMVHFESIEVTPGQTVALSPGDKHIMFMGLNGDPFEVGEEIPVTLVFERAGRINVIFQVEARKETRAERIHSRHDLVNTDGERKPD